ncbi:MAG: LytTR family transcriptional regulator DNA-binding domain-containing protein [Saprospiraceae bacterium]|nr:LytTR family transcriptional regulator DNA-binding domain-containing protein [Saprospiraceae bacterium]
MKLAKKALDDRHRVYLIIFIIVILVLFFESAQQLYYVKRYAILPDPEFWSILKSQSRRWLVWALFIPPLNLLIQHHVGELRQRAFLWRIPVVILLCCACAVGLVAIMELCIAGMGLDVKALLSEFLPFFFYQKGPIYLAGYAATAFVLVYHLENRQLKVEVLGLAEMKAANVEMAARIADLQPQESHVLSVRVGKNRRLIPVSQVIWVAADDYCSRIHTREGRAYSMRISLKALQETLGSNFIRVHRSALVNKAEIREVSYAHPASILLLDGTRVPVARSRMKTLNQLFPAPG